MQNRELSKKQIIVVSLISLLFLAAAIGGDLLMKAKADSASQTQEQTATLSEAVSETEKPLYQYGEISSRITDMASDAPYTPGPEVLNLAYYYPEGADTGDVINSYAGRLYTKLTQMEAEYMSSLYNLGDKTPLELAAQLGLARERVLGKFNPQDSSHVPDQPDSWIINRLKNVNISFYDGDGNRINGYSTVKEIMSMASVYCYYHDRMDPEAMEQYALALWANSHSDNISLGNVYYDSGCLAKSIEEEEAEALELERQQALMESQLAGVTSDSAGDQALELEEQNAAAGVLEAEPGAAGAVSGTATGASAETETAAAETTAAQKNSISAAASGSSQQAAQGTDGAAGNTAGETIDASGAGAKTAVSGENGQTAGETNQAGQANPQISDIPAGTQTARSAAAASAAQANAGTADSANGYAYSASVSESGAEKKLAAFSQNTSMPFSAMSQEQTVQDAANGAAQPQGSAESASSAMNTAPSETPEGEIPSGTALIPTFAPRAFGPAADLPQEDVQDTGAAASVPAQTPAQTDSAAQTLTQESAAAEAPETSCPGHIDLYVTVKLQGIDDAYGLFAADPTGNNEANFNDQWSGWTPERIAEARALNAQDWFTQYGLTISAINVRDPLSESEIQDYMAMLPAELSQTRRDLIDFALHSVGKIPYYWGGKPYAARYERNGFGTLIQPDTKGRVLRGLDCSGWINWVYWSVLGQPLKGESTATLIGCGRRISRTDLKAGDIMVRTGPDAHVVMFLGWASNGAMIVVHESAGTTNNVTVSEMTADWPYYRALIE